MNQPESLLVSLFMSGLSPLVSQSGVVESVILGLLGYGFVVGIQSRVLGLGEATAPKRAAIYI